MFITRVGGKQYWLRVAGCHKTSYKRLRVGFNSLGADHVVFLCCEMQ